MLAPGPPRPDLRLGWVAALFVLSGAAALVYQVVWQRILALHSGVGLYSVAMIVAAFMAGLGGGSQLGGGREREGLAAARRFGSSPGSSSRSAAFGAASTWIYYDWLYPARGQLPSPSLAGAASCTSWRSLPPTVAHGHVAPVPGARRGARGGGGPHHRLALRRERGRARPWAPSPTPWLALPAIRHPRGGRRGGCRANGRGRPRRARAWLAPAAAPRALRRPPVAAAARGAPRPRPAGRSRLGGALRALGLRRAVARDRLVPAARRGGEVDGLHVRHACSRSTCSGSGLGSPRRAPRLATASRRPLRAFLLGASARSCRSRRCRSSPWWRCRPARSPSTGSSRPTGRDYDASSSLGHDPTGAASSGSTCLLPLALFFAADAPHGPLVPDPAARGPRRPATSGRKVGILQAANIAGCVGREPARGPRWRSSAWARRDAAAARARSASCSPRRAAALRARLRAAGARGSSALAVLLPGPEALWRRLHGVGAEVPLVFFEEDATSVVALTPDEGGWRSVGQRQGQQLAAVRQAATRLLGAMPATSTRRRATSPSSVSARATRRGPRPGAPRPARSPSSRSRRRSRASCGGSRLHRPVRHPPPARGPAAADPHRGRPQGARGGADSATT